MQKCDDVTWGVKCSCNEGWKLQSDGQSCVGKTKLAKYRFLNKCVFLKRHNLSVKFLYRSFFCFVFIQILMNVLWTLVHATNCATTRLAHSDVVVLKVLNLREKQFVRI